MHLGQILKILKNLGGGRTPILKILNFFEILFDNIIECLYITLETKFHPSRSIIEDFDFFRGGGRTPFLKILNFFFIILIRVPI